MNASSPEKEMWDDAPVRHGFTQNKVAHLNDSNEMELYHSNRAAG